MSLTDIQMQVMPLFVAEGLSQVSLSRIESGGGAGSAATRRKLAKTLEAPVRVLER